MNEAGRLSRQEAERIVVREADNLAHLSDIGFDVRVELGRKQMNLSHFEALQLQDVIGLDKLAGESFEIRVNGHLFGEGEITVVTDQVACRITSVRVPPPSTPARLLHEALGDPLLAPAAYEQVDPVPGMSFIAGGCFTMGTSADDSSPAAERPAHKVTLVPYYIDTFPVTNQAYKEFVDATGQKFPSHWRHGSYPPGQARHPVVNVSWQEASAFAQWKGKRLPSEAEWEKAARGTDERHYPWGDRFVDDRCNYGNTIGTTVDVDRYPLGRSPYGVWDLSGNVYEWCQDYFEADYYKHSPEVDPRGPEHGDERVIRGGFFSETRPRAMHRASAPETDARDSIGFRLALDALVNSHRTEGSDG